jgi:hypothetical protein
VSIVNSQIYSNTATNVRAHLQNLKVPIAPMGKLLTRLPRLSLAQLQQVCSAADLKFSQRPDGKLADVLASTLARTTAADAPVHYREYVPQRP